MLIDRTADEIDIVFVVPDQGSVSLKITSVFGVQISAVPLTDTDSRIQSSVSREMRCLTPCRNRRECTVYPDTHSQHNRVLE